MPKPKKYDTSQDEPRKVIMDALLRTLTNEKLHTDVRRLWTGFVRIWEASYEVRQSIGTLFTPQEIVAEFLGRLERAMLLNLPKKLYETLEGRRGGR